MSSTHASLDAQANERKARLAKLRSLKRKQSPADDAADEQPAKSPSPDAAEVASRYLSGRNYDVSVRGPKLGFENGPADGQPTLEDQAISIVKETAERQAEEDKADKPVDLFKLQPKKPNWDLKRDLEKKLERLNVRTENAIARLVRQRIQEQQRRDGSGDGNAAVDGDEMVLDGASLVSGVHLREREEEEDERRAKEDGDST